MKQKDILLVVVVGVIAAVSSFLICNKLFSSPAKRAEKIEVVQKITDEFPAPNPQYFNKDAFDPTRIITIGDGNSADPFTPTATQ